MTAFAWLLVLSVVAPASYLVWMFFATDRRSATAIQSNLVQGLAVANASSSQRAPLMLDLARRLTPDGYAAKIDRWLALAGRPTSMPLERVIMAKPALALVGAVLGMLFFSKNPTPQLLVVGLALTAFMYFLPDLLIYNSGVKRQQAIQLELPNTLDQMLISVEAGLGFEAAMARAGRGGKGPIAMELLRTLQDIQVGRPRIEAYQALAQRSSVADLRSFVRAVVQADRYGIGIARVLRAQAKQARTKRRQRAEEKAMQLPVKVLFPLLLFIFPVLFIVILGPAAINIIEAFK